MIHNGLPDMQVIPLSPNVILISKKLDFNTSVILYDEINNFKRREVEL
ncbi:hypothetical protein YSY43_35830 [Paenibacillus sp. YSY-4.3]